MKNDRLSRTFSIIATFLSIFACVISITYGVSMCGCEIDYIGVAVGLIGVCATLMVGYQIWNTIDVKESIKRNEKVAEEFENLQRKVELYEKRSQENIDIIHSLISHQIHLNLMSDAEAVLHMHHAVLSSLNSEREDLSDILGYLSVFISELSEMALTVSNLFVSNSKGNKIIQDARSPYYGMTVEYAINEFMNTINETDEQIKKHERYKSIKVNYEKVMDGLGQKIIEIKNTNT